MLHRLQPGTFYGTTVGRYDLPAMTLAETIYPSGLVIPPHEHVNAFFCFLLEGSCAQTWARRSWVAGAPSLTVFPAGVVHANHWHDRGGRVLHVEFSPRWLEQLQQRPMVLDRPAEYRRGLLVRLASRLLEECRRPDDASPLAVEGLVLEVLAETSRSRPELRCVHPPRWLAKVVELLHDRFSENLYLIEVAAVAGISADHLTRSFRQHHGCTIGEYVRRLRVEYACQRLASLEVPLVQIALDAGFCDQSHFTKAFKRHMGVTPAAFRNRHCVRISRTRD